MTNAADTYRTAAATLDRFEQQIATLHTRIAEARADTTRSAAYTGELVAELEAELHELVRTTRDSVTKVLTAVERKADVELRGDPTDAALEARKARAAHRVARLLDGGRSPVEAAEVFAASGDLDGLRALRDEVPAFAAVAGDTFTNAQRAVLTRDLTLQVDRRMAPLLPPAEAKAVDVRLGVDAARYRLDSLVEHAIAPSVSSTIRLALAGHLPVDA